jgi:hypothetical protein
MKRTLLVLIVLTTAPAGAQQEYPDVKDCDTITKELAMRPPAFGNKARAAFDYQSYLGFCGFPPWIGMVGANDLEALKGMVCTHGGMVDHANTKLNCY